MLEKRINKLLGTDYKSDSEIDWYNISNSQVLSEKFIEEFKDKLDWDCISRSQILGWDFILKHSDFVNWDYIAICQPFINPNDGRIDKGVLKYNNLYYFYSKTKDLGWFWGYMYTMIGVEDYFTLNPNSGYYSCNLIKSKIYWKDLIMISRTKSYEPIRVVKICGKE